MDSPSLLLLLLGLGAAGSGLVLLVRVLQAEQDRIALRRRILSFAAAVPKPG